MLALWILLGLCTFLALLLLLPLHIYLAFTPEAGFSFYARYAFLTIRQWAEQKAHGADLHAARSARRQQHGQRAQRRLGQGRSGHAA